MLPLHRPLRPVKGSVSVKVHTSRPLEDNTPQLVVIQIYGDQ